MPKIVHYRDKCIGCGICFEMQPGIWRMSKKDGKATLVKAVNKKGVFILDVEIQDTLDTEPVAGACPVNLIKIW